MSAPLTAEKVKALRRTLYAHFKTHGRMLPWREPGRTAYQIFISEVMLQQTQVARVTVKFKEFVTAFPDFAALHGAPLGDVLRVWQGMGYNRRALMLKKAAALILEKFNGILPEDPAELITLPGIGKATAASIAAFAFNKPTLFIETNIRTVFIHHFFNDTNNISDDQILALLKQTIDKRNPYKFYSALMDYGTSLKQLLPNPSRKSTAYVRQSKFEGSKRQLRGAVLRLLTSHTSVSITKLKTKLAVTNDRVEEVVRDMAKEGLLKINGKKISIE